ncbi:hypothetical protein [Streptomyces sp. NRRL B-1381]|uniref:hypothetical protein n=1 Tax=Streptomyces sp. NRRL B-1381 TaxID=1463829 RepID=UPI000A875AA7|nr:hypothetical protein [Streptomyces sp. NRRL B-1381]
MTTQTPWPEHTLARYLTVGGATVDIDELNMSRCTGCNEDDSDDRFVSRGNPLRRARRWAQSHAETCRAMPKPA